MGKSKNDKTRQEGNAPTNASWGGRFDEPVDAFVARFTASVDFDQRLAHEDIQGSIAHAQMLQQAGILDASELTQIVDGLKSIAVDIKQGQFTWSQALEDVHMNI